MKRDDLRIDESLNSIFLAMRRRRLAKRAVALLSVVVVFFTMNQTKFMADTLERVPTCGLEEHAHTEDCLDEAGENACGIEEHAHTDACFQARPVKDAAEEEDLALESFIPEAELLAAQADEAAIEVEAAADEYRFAIEDRSPVLLSEVLAAVELAVEGIQEVGQVVDEAHPEGMIRLERLEDGDLAIYAMRSFDVVELAIITEKDFFIVALTDAVVVEATAEPEVTVEPTSEPEMTVESTVEPSVEPVETIEPEVTVEPTSEPKETVEPTIEPEETIEPTVEPEETVEPTSEPEETVEPTIEPEETVEPTVEPEETVEPTVEPEVTVEPTIEPEETVEPTVEPEETVEPTIEPEETVEPTVEPEETIEPTVEPEETVEPTIEPEETVEPTIEPEETVEPTIEPEETVEPTVEPEETVEPTIEPEETVEPTLEPTIEPTVEPIASATYSAVIDLAGAEGPFSLNAWLAQAADEGAVAGNVEAVEIAEAAEEPEAIKATEETESTEPTEAPEAAEAPTPAVEAPEALPEAAWTLTYDAALLAAEYVGGDYAVALIADFEQATLGVETGAARYALTLLNGAAARDAEALSGARKVPVEGADYALYIQVPEAANLSDEATFKAQAVADETYNRAALDAVAGENCAVLAQFDLTIYEGEQIVQPAAALSISVDFGEALAANARVYAVHFPGTGAQPETVAPVAPKKLAAKPRMAAQALAIDTEATEAEDSEAIETDAIDADNDGNGIVTFRADSFSVYAIVADFVTPTYETPALSLQENVGYLFANNDGGLRYILNSIYADANPNGLRKTAEWQDADLFYFERPEGSADGSAYYVYTLVGGEKNYLYFEYFSNNEGHVKLSTDLPENPLTVTVADASKGLYFISGTDVDANGQSHTWYLNQHSGAGGVRFAGWHQNNNGSRIAVTQPVDLSMDALGLDGETYGLINFKSDISGYVMLADAFNGQRLQRKKTLIKEDPLTHDGRLFIAQGADAAMWTFRAVREDIYMLTLSEGETTRYLSVSEAGLKLVDEYDPETCDIRVVPGTGGYAGKVKLVGMDGSVVRMHENAETNGFGVTTASGNANDWLNLVVRSNLNDEDFVAYSAEKVSVSDDVNVANGRQVVVYTRAWNDTKKEYEFYAVDHDGSLVRVYENGDELNWIGTQVNTLLWNFTEYYYEGTTTPNNYYELQNAYSGNYLAPQIQNGQILSGGTIGINLLGRRNGEYETTILAWDDPSYQYAGLKVEDGRLVACPISEAEDFCFAVMEPITDQLTTVATVDNNSYGISVRMIDYNGAKQNNGSFDDTQTAVMGSTGDDKGLVNPYLEADGYPIATRTGRSLSELFGGASSVNHLFLENTYYESGYFEYNCTENFAHLVQPGDKWLDEGYSVGDFVVYDQVGTIETNNVSLKHGQFMPYNDIQAGRYSTLYENLTDETDGTLPYTDPRKDMKLYTIPYDRNKGEGVDNNANYHFGMEMEASFTQTASGLDAWGHDIIFEFAGDDDMFLFVDGVLVLDLGGVHAAKVGKVNFRTGQVTSSRENTTLRQLFETSYKAQNPSATSAEITAWLDGIFKPGTSVFQDYSTHSMKMIYMERGAGASNLHMRFNLAAVQPGAFVLSKTLSGAEVVDNALLEFPYQIYYYSKNDVKPTPHLLSDPSLVVYSGGSAPVTYAPSFTPAGGSAAYEHVFFLKAGESAEVKLPEDATEYYVVECGVNPDIYDQVTVNGVAAQGTETQNGNRLDYAVERATLANRAKVEYDNHVSEGAMRSLTITKKLYDKDGETLLTRAEDPTAFNFRLYLGSENASSESLPVANMYPYNVKDDQGNYCKWENGGFVSLGKQGYAQLTAAEREAATFHTSMNGAISKIPAGYTVEVRGLILDAQFMVEERDYEIPKGYTLRLSDGYSRVDAGHEQTGGAPITGHIEKDDDPAIEVRNQKGWGLTVEKVWTDADFMARHGDIFFAVYRRGQAGQADQLVEGTVRRLPANASSIYYFFENLAANVPFESYVVAEVLVTGELTIDASGAVTGCDTVTPIAEGGALNLGGQPVGGEYAESGYEYTVHYKQGELTDRNENVRTDTVTNARPGIALYKTDWTGAKLAGAAFTLKDAEGHDVAAEKYISDADGLITIAYLPEGAYTLAEIEPPKGFASMPQALTIQVGADGSIVALTGAEDYFTQIAIAEGAMAATIQIKNKPTGLQVRKIDAETREAIAGVHFALYMEVTTTDGALRKDYLPLAGYEDLVTDASGILEAITMDLGARAYYLTETQADGYTLLEEDLRFVIGEDGSVTVTTEGYQGWLASTEVDGKIAYEIAIENSRAEQIQIKKVGSDSGTLLAGARFALYAAADYDDVNNRPVVDAKPLIEGETDEDGLLSLGGLVAGEYRLVETVAPGGYNLLDAPVRVTVRKGEVSAAQGSGLASVVKSGNVHVITVLNNPGYVLPSTGGSGTAPYTIAGVALIALALILLVCRRRMNVE